jgi:hypothetical protein
MRNFFIECYSPNVPYPGNLDYRIKVFSTPGYDSFTLLFSNVTPVDGSKLMPDIKVELDKGQMMDLLILLQKTLL